MRHLIKLLTCIVFASQWSPLQSMDAPQQLEGQRIKQELNLQHDYLPITKKMRDNCIFVLQGTYIEFGPTHPDMIGILGPLCPYIGVVAKYSEGGNSLPCGIVAHLDYQSNLSSVFHCLKKLGQTPENWQITLYTTTTLKYDEAYGHSYQGRSQMEELEFLKQQFIDVLKLERNQVSTAEGAMNNKGGEYTFIHAFLGINAKGTVFSVAPLKDDLFKLRDNDYSPPLLSMQEQINLFRCHLSNYTGKFYFELMDYRFTKKGLMIEKGNADSYGSIPLTELIEFNIFLNSRHD